MAAINGVVAAGTFVPSDDTDTYAITDNTYAIDGHRSVPDSATMYAIPVARRRQGMLVAVHADTGDGANCVWQLNAPPWNFDATDWSKLATGGGTTLTEGFGIDITADVISIDPTYPGQDSITTVGHVTSGIIDGNLGMTQIILKNKNAVGSIPAVADLVPGEVALNLADTKLYCLSADSLSVVQLAGVGMADSVEEVYIGPDDPTTTLPTTELWYDTDELGPDNVPSIRRVDTIDSLIGGGDLSQDLVLSLENDDPAPPALHYYGTDENQVKGFHLLPIVTVTAPPLHYYGTDDIGVQGYFPLPTGTGTGDVPSTRKIDTDGSILGGGDLSVNRVLMLDGDDRLPPLLHYYGTNSDRVKGFHELPASTLPLGGLATQVLAKHSDLDNDVEWVFSTGDALPEGGTPNQVLTKLSLERNHVGWQDPAALPLGGIATQVLAKHSDVDLDVHWVTTTGTPLPIGGQPGDSLVKLSLVEGDMGWRPVGIPPGGIATQVLAKHSDVDNDVEWLSMAGAVIPSGGQPDQVLTKLSLVEGDLGWRDVQSLPPGGVVDQILVKLSDKDGDAGWGWSNAVDANTAINTVHSIVGGGNLTTDRYISLDGDEAAPPPGRFYGTDAQGKKGFHPAAGLPPGGVVDQILVKLSDIDGDAGWGWSNAVDANTAINTVHSIVGGGNLTTDRYLSLDGDEAAPPPGRFYGTDPQGKKGFHLVGGSFPPGGVVDQILVKLSDADANVDPTAVGWGWSNAVDANTTINTVHSIIGGGNLTTDRYLSLDGDEATPLPFHFYGTDAQGKKGFHPAAGLPPGGVVDQILTKLSDKDNDAGWGWSNAVDPNTAINTPMSVVGGGNLTTDRYLTLDGDDPAPPASSYYGTNKDQVKGFHPLVAGDEVFIGVNAPADPAIELWCDLDEVSPVGPAGPQGPPGPAGPQGQTGVASLIVGNFGTVATPTDLPPDGLIPVDWDGPGKPSTSNQMRRGQSLYYDNSADPLDGHIFQYMDTSLDPSGWLDIGLIQGPPGPQGDPGPAGPTIPGGLTDQALVKISGTDGDIGWGGPFLQQIDADTRYVQLVGSTMTGPLVLPADPVNDLEAATKQYVDVLVDDKVAQANATFVNSYGDTMTGALTLPADPVNDLEAATKQYVDSLDALNVKIAGGIMTGELMLLADPTLPLEAATKQYVDQSIAASALYQGVWQVVANVPDLTPATMNPLNGWSWIAQTVDPNVPETAPAGLPGIGGMTVDSGDRIIWNTGTTVYELVKGSSLSINEASALFVDTTGDTMTGPLMLAADPTANLQAATKQYVDALASGLPAAGLTGQPLIKLSDADGDAGWNSNVTIDTAGNITASNATFTNGGVQGASSKVMSFGLGGQVGGTYRHEIRTSRSNATPAQSFMEFFVNDAGTNGPNGVPSVRTLRMDASSISFYRPISSANTFSGTNTFSTTTTFSGAANFSTTTTFSGAANFSNTTTFSSGRTATFNGTTTFSSSGTVTLNGTTTLAAPTTTITTTNGVTFRGSGNAFGYWNLITPTRLDGLKVFQIQAMHSANAPGGVAEGQFYLKTSNGSFGIQDSAYTTVASATGWYFTGNISCASLTQRSSLTTKTDVKSLSQEVVDRVFAAIKPITYNRIIKPGEGATQEPPPFPQLGLAVEDIEEAKVDGLVLGDGEDRGWSVSGMLTVALAEIKRLKQRLDQLEAASGATQ